MKTPYKLKNEIKEFIIAKKKTNPKLSCRNLVSLIQENFNTAISKSAINAVIKESNLSSPVGRTRIREKITPPPLFLAQPQPAPKLAIDPLAAAFRKAPSTPPPMPVEEKPAQPLIKPETPKPQPLPPEAVGQPQKPEQAPLEATTPPQPASTVPPPGSTVPPAAPVPVSQSVDIKTVRKEMQFVQNGGCFLLTIADLKTKFTAFLVEKLALYLPDLPADFLPVLLEANIYQPIFPDKKSLWQFLGQEIGEASFNQYSHKLSQIPISELREALMLIDPQHKINEINELYKQCLVRLNSAVQEEFFPTVYQFLDFSTMYSRFYCLYARIEEKPGTFNIQFCYPQSFSWVQDIVWQEDFLAVTQTINEKKIFTRQEEQIVVDNNVRPCP